MSFSVLFCGMEQAVQAVQAEPVVVTETKIK